MRPYAVLMSPRKLFAIMIALAVLLAPAFTRLGETKAALPADHHAQMVEGNHCQSPESNPDDGGQAPAESCCVSTCMGVAVAPDAAAAASHPAPARAAFAVRSLHLNYLGEIATPPPKTA